MFELIVAVVVFNAIFALSSFVLSLKILSKMKNHKCHSKCLIEGLPQTQSESPQVRPLISPIQRRKPVIMDDARAYQIEQKELETRKRV